MDDFLFFFTFLLRLLLVLGAWSLPFVGIGLAAYYVFRGRVSRWTLRALVVGVPLAVALGVGLLIGAMVLFVDAISE
jgi:hypothetical protein